MQQLQMAQDVGKEKYVLEEVPKYYIYTYTYHVHYTILYEFSIWANFWIGAIDPSSMGAKYTC